MPLKKLLLKNSLLNIVTYAYLLIASFFSIPILLNSLGKDLFGAYIIIGGLITLISTLDLGLGQAAIRYLSLPDIDTHRRHRYWQTSFSLFLIIGSIMAILCAMMTVFFYSTLPVMKILSSTHLIQTVFLIVPSILVNFTTWHFLTIVQSEQRFDLYSLRGFIAGSANTLITAWVSKFFPSIPVILITQLFFNLIALSIIISFSNQHFKLGNYPKIHPKITRKLLGFGLKNFIGRVANQFSAQFSNYVLGGFSAIFVTAYSIPKSIVLKAAGGVSQLTLAIFPLSASLLTKDRVTKLRQLVIGLEIIIFIGGILSLFVVDRFGYPFLLWWLKDLEVVSLAFPVLKLLTWFFFLTSLTPIPSVVLDSLNYPQIPSFFAVVTTIIETVLIFLLTPKYQILGPAYATVISSAIMAPLFLLVFAFTLQKEIKKIQSSIDGVPPTMHV